MNRGTVNALSSKLTELSLSYTQNKKISQSWSKSVALCRWGKLVTIDQLSWDFITDLIGEHFY